MIPDISFELPPLLVDEKPEVIEGSIGGYKIYHLTDKRNGEYLLDATGKIIAENCRAILPCEDLIIKYDKIEDLPKVIERVEKKNYQQRKTTWPHKKAVSWKNKEGELMEGQVYTAPVNTDSLIIFQQLNKGRKKYFSVHPDAIIE